MPRDAQLANALADFAARHPAWRTRFAPAPTGWLHLGHAVNAVWVWSVAQAFGGTVLLRVEDHDRTRCRPEYERGILDDLDWLGLHADIHPTESYRADGPHPARQSDHGARYTAALDSLAAKGLVYPCLCSRRDIAQALGVGDSRADGVELPYPGTCRDARVDGATHLGRRIQLGEHAITVRDLRHGPEEQRPAAQCGDLLARDRHGAWTYQFAVVVDDLAQHIGLIIRGDDLRASSGRQQQLATLLGGTAPIVLHHPLVRHPDGAKLSKSNHDTGLRELRAAGRTPAEVLGLAAMLGGLQPTPVPRTAESLGALWF
jgi:glutamyl-tRNA synthetase/glutamyl-Q tRNA(Asp) synthetase